MKKWGGEREPLPLTSAPWRASEHAPWITKHLSLDHDTVSELPLSSMSHSFLAKAYGEKRKNT